MRLPTYIAVAIAASCASTGIASPITYQFSANATGSVGATSFSNAPVTITLAGDTAAIFVNSGLAVWRNPVVGTILIGGVGTANVTEPIGVSTLCGVTPEVRIDRPPILPVGVGNEILGARTIPLAACSLNATASAVGLTPFVSGFLNLATSLGPLTITSMSSVAYQATAGASPEPVPVQGAFGISLLVALVTFVTYLAGRDRSHREA